MQNRLESFYLEYRALVPVALLFLVTILVYNETALLIFNEWQVGEYSHGMLAIPIVLYLLSLDRDDFAIAERIHWLPVLGLLATTIGWICAKAANVFFVEILALFGIFTSALGLLHGPSVWYTRFAALLSLFLVMPVWGIFKTPLQVISADMTEIILRLIGLAVYREEFTFMVPGGAFLIEPACSGLGFFLSSCLLSVIYSKVFNLTTKNTLFLFLIAIAISIVSNWIRIVIIIVVGNETQMQHPIVSDHLTFGWILFSIMLIPFIVIANKLISQPAHQPAANQPEDNAARWSARSIRQGFIVALLLCVGPAMLFALQNRPATTESYPLTATLEALIPTPTNRLSAVDWKPTYVGATQISARHGVFKQRAFKVLSVYYQYQNQGEELIYWENSLFDQARWKVVSRTVDGKFNILMLRDRSGRERLITYSYFINGKLVGDARRAKLYELAGFLTGNREAFLIGVALDNPNDNDGALIDDIKAMLLKNV